MKRNFIGDLLFLLSLVRAGQTEKRNASEVVNLQNDGVAEMSLFNLRSNASYFEPYAIQSVTIAPHINIMYNVTYIPSNCAFLIFQIHTYQYNVTLSYDAEGLKKTSNSSVFGSNIGLVVKPNRTDYLSLYLRSDNAIDIEAMIAVTLYDYHAPIPGGCNMEFNTETAPYSKVFLKNGIVVVESQPASMPRNDSVETICGKNSIEHDVYVFYLTEQDFSPESYFTYISTMMTVEDIKRNGQKVPASSVSSPMRRLFSAYTGVGSIYVTVATVNGNKSAAYVPTFSYACDPVVYPESCEILPGSYTKVICALTFFMGCFFLCLGKLVPVCDMCLSVFFTTIVFAYTIMVSIFDYSPQAQISISIGLGFLFFLLWIVFLGRIPMIGILSCTFALGLFVSSVLYFRVPGAFIIVQNNFVFWPMFMIIAASVSLIAGMLWFASPIITSAIFSSFMIILPLDYLCGSALKYILINVIRRATVSGFGEAFLGPPVQTKDVLLIVVWSLIAGCRVFAQWLPLFSK